MKKIIALLLAVTMIFCMTSCRAKDEEAVSSTAAPKTTQAAETTTAEETTQEEIVTETTTSTTTSTTTLTTTSTTGSTTASTTVSTAATVATSETKPVETTTTATTKATTTATTTAAKTQATTVKSGGRDIEKFRGKKLLAITFDDGPYTPVTTSLLNRLDKYDARVTFFVLGSRLDGNKSYRDTMKKAYQMGNQIASHTYSHSDLTTLSDEALKKEISKANASVKNVIGVEPDAVRPPYGSINAKVQKAMNKHIIIWSIDPLDWKYKNSDTVCNNIVSKAFDGGIVLLHDLYQTSVDGAIKAMDKLSKKGYAFVTVNELAQLRGVEMNSNTKYYQFKPAQ